MQEKLCVESKNDCHLRAPAVGAKIGVFLYVTLGLLARGGHSLNKYCMTVYGSILMQFQRFFQNGLVFQMYYIVLMFVPRWRHYFREIAVKNCDKSKNRRKGLCTQIYIGIGIDI